MVALAVNPGRGVLSGTTFQTASGGLATFSDLSVDKAASGYELVAFDGSYGPAISLGFNINPATPDHLAFGVQPSNAVAGAFLSPAVTVQVLDQFNNLVTNDGSKVTVALSANPVSGNLGGNVTVPASGGVATFPNLWVDKVATGYSLAASDGTLGGATSRGFAISPASGNHIVFSQQPTSAAVGQSISPPVTMQEVDQFGNLVTNDSTSYVVLTLAKNPGSSDLLGTTHVQFKGGVASTSDLSLDHIGTGYQLLATDGGISGPSGLFNVTTTATSTTISVNPTPTVFGQATTFSATVTQPAGYSVTPVGTVTFTIDGVAQKPAPLDVTGVATFSTAGLAVGTHKATAAYNPTADFLASSTPVKTPLMHVVNQAATYTTAVPTKTGIIVGATITVTVTVRAVSPGAGTPQGNILFSVDGVARAPVAVNALGVALFSMTPYAGTHTVIATYKGNATYIGSASAPPLTITVVGPQPVALSSAFSLGLTVAPNAQFSVQVTALNALGQTATGYSAPVSIVVLSHPTGGTLAGTLKVQMNSGVALFSGLSAAALGTYNLEIVTGNLIQYITLTVTPGGRQI
jgi:hypothetical protein